MKGIVGAINISEIKGVVKTPIDKGYFKVDHGLEGDAHAGNWHRQVSLLAEESVETMRAMGVENLSAGKFAENLTTKGIELWKLPVGTKMRIGETLMEVSQIGKECHHGCAIKQQVGKCIMPTQGIFTIVLEPGFISVGDTIEILGES
jgi:MOSC domain-containing protein YiiM